MREWHTVSGLYTVTNKEYKQANILFKSMISLWNYTILHLHNQFL